MKASTSTDAICRSFRTPRVSKYRPATEAWRPLSSVVFPTSACAPDTVRCCLPMDLSVSSSQDLLAVTHGDLAQRVQIHLGVDLGGVRRSVTDEVSDRLE